MCTFLSVFKGSRKASRSIASLTCLVLRKCLPQVALPLASLKNPNPFVLPIVQISRETANLVSPSSSTKTTTSDLSTQLSCSEREEQHRDSDDEEEEDEDASTSPEPAPSYLHPSPKVKNAQKGKRHSLQHGLELSDFEVSTRRRATLPQLSHLRNRVPDSSSTDVDCDGLSSQVSSFSENVEVKVDINVELYKKYFPELEESQESLSVYYSSVVKPPKPSNLCNQEPEITPLDLEKESKKSITVVVVPTPMKFGDSVTDSSEMEPDTPVALFKTAANFVEEPAPQVLGHAPPTKPELMYNKSLSVDRLVPVM